MAKAKYICLVVLFLCFDTSASEFELVVGIARGQLERPDNGVHWDHSQRGGWDMTESDRSPMFSIGLRYNATSHSAVEIRYHDWGKYSQFLGAYPNDVAYESGEVIAPCTDCAPTVWWYNNVKLRGLTVTGIYERPVAGNFGVIARAGAAVVYSVWNFAFHSASDLPHSRQFSGTGEQKNISLTGTLGVGVTYGFTRLEYIYVHDTESNPEVCCTPPQRIRAIELSFRQPF
jgi:hypothetical protein